MAQYVQQNECNDLLCKEKIHDGRDLKLRLQQIRKEKGGLDFQKDPTYVELSRCKGVLNDTFMSKTDCEKKGPKFKNYKPKAKTPKKASPASANKKKKCPPGTRRNKKTGNCDNKNKSAKANAPSPKPKQASPKQPSPKQPSPKQSNKNKRCPAGSRRNKKTGNCDKYK